MLLVFVLAEVVADLPDAGFGSCHGLNLPVIWGRETRSREVRIEDGRWKRREKVEYSASFYLHQNPTRCVLFDFVRDAFITKTLFCRDSIWVMLIWAGVLDLWCAIWFESNKEPLWIPAQNTNEACSMLTRWESLANSFNLFQAPLGFQVFISDHKPKHPGRGSCCHISSPSDKAHASEPACCCKIPALP